MRFRRAICVGLYLDFNGPEQGQGEWTRQAMGKGESETKTKTRLCTFLGGVCRICLVSIGVVGGHKRTKSGGSPAFIPLRCFFGFCESGVIEDSFDDDY